MNKKRKKEEQIMKAVQQSGNKKSYLPDRLLQIMNEKNVFHELGHLPG